MSITLVFNSITESGNVRLAYRQAQETMIVPMDALGKAMKLIK